MQHFSTRLRQTLNVAAFLCGGVKVEEQVGNNLDGLPFDNHRFITPFKWGKGGKHQIS